MSKRYTAIVDQKAGFTLLELLIVMFLVALILGATLPTLTILRQEAFPRALENIFQFAVLSAMSKSEAVTIDFRKHKVQVLDNEWPYPKGLEPDHPAKVTVNPNGFVHPCEILFYQGKQKVRARIGLIGVTVI